MIANIEKEEKAKEIKIAKENLLKDMELTRQYCSLIISARNTLGFTSLKYPLITVWINKFLNPWYRQLIADECNFIGYEDIPAVEVINSLDNIQIPKNSVRVNGPYDLFVYIDVTQTPWQQEMYEKRQEKRLINESKKQK